MPDPVEVKVAVLTSRLDDCQSVEKDCRNQNEAEHNQLFDRMREAEMKLALVCQRVAMWSAIGSVVGGAAVGIVTFIVQRYLTH